MLEISFFEGTTILRKVLENAGGSLKPLLAVQVYLDVVDWFFCSPPSPVLGQERHEGSRTKYGKLLAFFP